MIEFEKIKFKNIQSYGNSFTEIVLNSHNITLYVGTNGSGKCLAGDSTIFVNINNNETKLKFEEYLNGKSKIYQ